MLVEVAVVAVVLIIVMIFVELTPYLVSSTDESIGVYQGKEFRKGTATIAKGQSVRVEYFNYSTFDPAILVVNMEFQTWQSPGTLTIAVNGKVFASIVASPEKPKIDVNVISVSGADWVEPTSIYAPVFGNAISFTSEIGKGYEGDFSYQIVIRGSR
jgi:hypothetical protein